MKTRDRSQGVAGAHFDKNKDLAVEANQIELIPLRAPVTGDYLVFESALAKGGCT